MEMQRKETLSKRILPQIMNEFHTPEKLAAMKSLQDSILESTERLQGCATSGVRPLGTSQKYHKLLSGTGGARTVFIDLFSED
jgi:hypothetical protein